MTITGAGQVAVFVAVDHYSAECVGIHAARWATRFEALEPIRQAEAQFWIIWITLRVSGSTTAMTLLVLRNL